MTETLVAVPNHIGYHITMRGLDDQGRRIADWGVAEFGSIENVRDPEAAFRRMEALTSEWYAMVPPVKTVEISIKALTPADLATVEIGHTLFTKAA